jgi:hypothetical protein
MLLEKRVQGFEGSRVQVNIEHLKTQFFRSYPGITERDSSPKFGSWYLVLPITLDTLNPWTLGPFLPVPLNP